MKNKTKHYYLLSLIGLLFTACGVRASSNCSIEDLLLNASNFPVNTIVNDISSPVAEYPEESAGITASYNQDLIYHLVGRYPSGNISGNRFKQSLVLYFGRDSNDQPWNKPVELSFNSLISQQYAAACGIKWGKYQCRMIGQYDEYYVFFFSYISEQGVNIGTFQEFLQQIDEKFAQCLNK